MKNILLFLVLLTTEAINGQTWQWAKRAGSTSVEIVSDLCVDKSGNVYIAGYFSTNNPWAPYMLFDTDTVYNIGVNQIFVAKYSPVGTIIWAKGIGGYNANLGSPCTNCESANNIEFDSITNSILLTGRLYGQGTFGVTILNGWGNQFITKIDLNGNFIWAKILGNGFAFPLGSVYPDPNGNIFFTGGTNVNVYFDTVLVSSGRFWAKLDKDGNAIWAKNIGKNTGSGKLFFLNNSIYSLFTTTNDTSWIDTSMFVSTSTNNMLFAKFDTLGNLNWYKHATSSTYLFSQMDADSSGNFYIAGAFQNNIDFGTITLTNPNFDMFIAKYDSLGNLNWTKQSNSQGLAAGNRIATSLDGNTYVVGSFSGSIILDSFLLNSSSNYEMFLARYNPQGVCIGVTQVPEAKDVKIAVDNYGNCYAIGGYNFNITIGNSTLTSFGSGDIFIAKHDAITGIPDPRRSTNNQLYIHANPNEGKCIITVPDDFLHEKNLVLSIYNSSGKLIQQKNLVMSEGKIKLSLEAEAKGLYNAVLSNGAKSYSGKIVFE